MTDPVYSPEGHAIPNVFTRDMLDWLPWLEPMAEADLTPRHMDGLVDASRARLAAKRGDLDAVRRFAEAVIATRGAVADEALAAFHAAGLSEQQALEVVLGISLATLCNFANSLAQSPVNPQLQPYLPEQFRQPQENAHAG